jgi:hypothetical protein
MFQEAPSDLPTFRHHHLEIAFFDVKDNCPVLRQTLEFDVLPQKETVVFPLIGQREPSFVFLNFNDYAFAKCLLDPIVHYSSLLNPYSLFLYYAFSSFV